MRRMRLKDAADALDVSQDTLRRWTNRGVLKCEYLPSGHRRFDPEYIEAVRLHMKEGRAKTERKLQTA